MPTPSQSSVAFAETETRSEEMHSTIEAWIDDLITHIADARASEQFQEWLDAQSRFHEYSYRNTLLIQRQQPGATRVAGYNTWQEEFDRQVTGGEQAIWIWAPIIAKQCPECGQSSRTHEDSDCAYDEIPPEEWPTDLVGFRPVPVFDISQTEGAPLPSLETAATGDVGTLISRLTTVAEELSVSVEIVPEQEWEHGSATGVCQGLGVPDGTPRVEVRNRGNRADLAVTLVHEYAHALLHADVDEDTERTKREVEAEAVAYVVGRHCGLDTNNSALYLAAWATDGPEIISKRLGRISGTAEELIEALGA
jgi:hypothetical protein